jgi:hypothetical protein
MGTRQIAFEGPVLAVWTSEDRVMPREHEQVRLARRLYG